MMTLAQAQKQFQKIEGIPFSRLFSEAQLAEIARNKGKAGQLLELALGLALSNRTLDFEDGELKSSACDWRGIPQETIAITLISSMFDEMVSGAPFPSTGLYKKIKNMLYVPVYRDDAVPPGAWEFRPCIHVDLTALEFGGLRADLERDYKFIVKGIRQQLAAAPGSMLRTISGRYLQIRTKDSGPPYHPIFSKVYRREISSKNFAFYFRKEFVRKIQEVQLCRDILSGISEKELRKLLLSPAKD